MRIGQEIQAEPVEQQEEPVFVEESMDSIHTMSIEEQIHADLLRINQELNSLRNGAPAFIGLIKKKRCLEEALSLREYERLEWDGLEEQQVGNL